MESIKCDICGNQRPPIEMVPVEYEDENYVVCIHCLGDKMYEQEMVFPENINNLVVGW